MNHDFQSRMTQFRAIRHTANLGEPLDGNDALALIEIANMLLKRLSEYAEKEDREHHGAYTLPRGHIRLTL